ncbi:MAG: glycosyltransferase family 1 protein [Planctomycetes bacterium]|nr:glycosyltransferase family 1 protein [Planctomycetota bacterium]
MNVFIITFGSRGDVQPYVALGKGLKTAGHTVTICTCSSFESFITDHGLNYGYAADDLMKLMDSVEGRDAMENTVGVFGTLKTMIKMMKQAKPINRQMMIDSWKAAQGADPDIVLFNSKALGAVSIAEKLGVPVMMALPQPMVVPTAEYPTIGLPNWNIGGWYNKLTYKLVHLGYRAYKGMVNEFRRNILGLDKFPSSSGLLYMADGRSIPVLHSFSKHVVPRPNDWPDNTYVTGYWFLNRLDEWEPSVELKAFLDKGEASIYVGFGSMAGRNPQRLMRIVIEALKQTNKRGIIASGWGGLAVGDLPDTIFKIDKAPHDWLFPRMAAVVHHGGAGTTAAGLRAGCPTIVCPFFGDQPFWGRCVRALGVGSEPIPQKKLTVEKLSAAIREVTVSQTIRQNAEALGEKIRNEDGIANAVAIFERIGRNV